MVRINAHYLTLRPTYLFSEIARRVKTYAAAHPDAKLIRLGIGDVTQPLPPAVVKALHDAVDDEADALQPGADHERVAAGVRVSVDTEDRSEANQRQPSRSRTPAVRR